MPKSPISIYGAIARFNYGDLLFPLILKDALESAGCDRPIEAIGLRASDLSPFGALPTKPVRWLADPANLPDGSKIIIAGGEALAAGWGRLYSHLLPQRGGDRIYSTMTRVLSDRRLDQLGRRRARVDWTIPFAPSPKHFANRVGVIFNAVGGSGLASLSAEWLTEVKAALQDADYASVRDRSTLDLVGGPSSRVELHPDSAAVMADRFPPDWLLAHCRPDVRRIIDAGRPFVCFQLHRYFADTKLQRFAAELDQLQSRDGIRVVLLPIGRAAGHSDQVALKKVRRLMSTPADLPEDLGVFDIMALLAHGVAYAGTSLHGLITAMSFARPYAVLGKNPKCLSFAATWAPEPFRGQLKASGFRDGLAKRIGISGDALEESAAELRRAADEGLQRVTAAALDDR